jgi:hypothetical protein
MVFLFCCFVLSVPLSIAGGVLGALALQEANRTASSSTGRGLAWGGIGTSIAGLVLGITYVLIVIVVGGTGALEIPDQDLP